MNIFKAILVAVLVLASSSVLAQPGYSIRYTENIDITLTDTDHELIYCLYLSTPGSFYINQTLPTQYVSGTSGRTRSTVFWTNGDVTINYEPNTVSGAEADSLALWIKPLIWDPLDNEYAEVTVDSTFLVFDTPEIYSASSVDHNDWTTAVEYSATVSGLLWPCAGFVIHVYQKAETAQVTTLSVWISYSIQLDQ